MTENHRENLSAGMDGELSPEALRFLLRRLDHDGGLQQAWSRYHVIGDSMRDELPVVAASGFAERVMRVIMLETSRLETSRLEANAANTPAAMTKPRHWMRWSAGGAIAAGVAVVALMATQPAGNPADHAAPQVAVGNAKTVAMTPPALAMHTAHSSSPAAVPAWLRDNSNVSQLSERATATLGSNGIVSPYASSLRPYQVSSRYRTLNNRDGSYLLLIDAEPTPAANQDDSQIRAAAH